MLAIWKIRVVVAALACLLFAGIAVAAAFAPFVESDAQIIHTFSGEQPGSTFGWVAANLGDINGDGVNDVITSAPWFSETAVEGKIYVFSGADGALLHSATGSGVELLGYSTTSAGDVNGDGTPDYIAGGPAASHAAVFSGADHTVLLDLYGAGDGFGASVSGAGDVNGDGYGDLIVGATRHNANAGRIYLMSGANGSTLWTFDGSVAGQRLGSAVGLVGDVNGDGVPDLVAGADGLLSADFPGAAYVLSGSDGAVIHELHPADPDLAATFGLFFASGAGDVDGDGAPDVYVGDYAGNNGAGYAYVFSGANGRLLHLFEGQEGMGLGPGRGVGDMDGDGRSDLVIGAYTYSTRDADAAGRVLAIAGGSGRVLRTLTGAVPGDWVGADALAVGDVNGDGWVDYMITAYGLTYNGLDVGHAYIVAGEPPRAR